MQRAMDFANQNSKKHFMFYLFVVLLIYSFIYLFIDIFIYMFIYLRFFLFFFLLFNSNHIACIFQYCDFFIKPGLRSL